MPGEVLISVHILLAIRDALVADDKDEAFHQLRMAADPECKNFLRYHDHWTPWEDIAAAVPAAHLKRGT